MWALRKSQRNEIRIGGSPDSIAKTNVIPTEVEGSALALQTIEGTNASYLSTEKFLPSRRRKNRVHCIGGSPDTTRKNQCHPDRSGGICSCSSNYRGKSSLRAGGEAAEEPRLVELLRSNRAHFEFDIESLRALPVQSDFLAVRRKRTSRDEHVIESRLQV